MSFSTELKTVMKLDDDQWKKSLKSIKQAEKETTKDIEKNTLKIFNLKEKLENKEKQLHLAKIFQNKENQKRFREDAKLIRSEIALINKRNNAQKAGLEFVKIRKHNTEAFRKGIGKETDAINKNNKATGNATNNLVRHLRQLETLVVVYFALTRGFQATIGMGLQVNKMIEDNTSGIAALLSANTQMVLSNGQVVDSYEKFRIGQKVAAETMLELKKASVSTFATFPQLTELFQQSIGHTLGMGKAFGTTTDEIIKNTIKLTQSISNIAGSIGMEMRKAQEEIRSLLSGNVSTDSLIAVLLFGSPTKANEAMRAAKKRGENGVKNMLDNMLEAFEPLKDTETYTRSLLKLEDAWSSTMQQLSKPIFDDLKTVFSELAKDISDNKDEITNSFEEVYDVAKETIGALGNVFEDAENAFASLEVVAEGLKHTVVGTVIVTKAMLGALSNGFKTIELSAIGWATLYKKISMSDSEYAAYLAKAKGRYNSLIREVKTFDELIASGIEAGQTMRDMFDSSGKTVEMDVKSLNSQLTQTRAILKQLEASGAEESQIERFAKHLKLLEGKLVTKLAIDFNHIAKRIKENNKGLEETQKLQALIIKDIEQRKKLEEKLNIGGLNANQIAATREQLSQLSIATENDKAKIAEINQKAAMKDLEISQALWVSEQGLIGVEVKKSTLIGFKIVAKEKEVALAEKGNEKSKKQTELNNLILQQNQALTSEKEKQNKLDEKFILDPITLDIRMKGFDEVSNAIAGIGNGMQDLQHINVEYQKDLIKIGKTSLKGAKLEKARSDAAFKSATATVGGFANMTGALAGFYDEDDDRREKQLVLAQVFQAAQMAMQVAQMVQSTAFTSLFVAQEAVKAQAAGATAVAVAAQSSPWTGFATAAAMIALLGSIGIALGGSGGGASQENQFDIRREEIENQYTPITDRLDRQISLLESIDLTGSVGVVSIEKALIEFKKVGELTIVDFRESLINSRRNVFLPKNTPGIESEVFKGQQSAEIFAKTLEKELQSLFGKDFIADSFIDPEAGVDIIGEVGGFKVITKLDIPEITSSLENTLLFLTRIKDSTIDFSGAISEGDIDDILFNIQGSITDFALSLTDVVGEMSSASESFRSIFDDITGSTKFADQELRQAFADFDSIRGQTPYVDYLSAQINAITKVEQNFNKNIQEILLSTDIDDILAQTDAVIALQEATNFAFEGGVKDALNYLDSIELVGEAMTTSVENRKEYLDSFKSEEQLLADLAQTIGVDVANNLVELDLMFETLSNDIFGLTDAEFELIMANKDYLVSIGEIEDSITSMIDSLRSFRDSMLSTSEMLQKTIDGLREGDLTEEDLLTSYKTQFNALAAEIDTFTDSSGNLLPQFQDDFTEAANSLSEISKNIVDSQILTEAEKENLTSSIIGELEAVKQIADLTEQTLSVFVVNKELTVTSATSLTDYIADQGIEPANNLNSFAVGSPFIPRDQVANIHRGEIIIDSQSASILRNYGIPTNSGDVREQIVLLKQILDKLTAIEITSTTTADSTESMDQTGIELREESA